MSKEHKTEESAPTLKDCVEGLKTSITLNKKIKELSDLNEIMEELILRGTEPDVATLLVSTWKRYLSITADIKKKIRELTQ